MKIWVIIFSCVPIILGFAFVGIFGVNCLYLDQWLIVELHEKFISGTMSFGDLFAQLGTEHRLFFPKIIMLILGRCTHWNNIAEMYFFQAIMLTFAIVIMLAVIRQFRPSEGGPPGWIPLLMFLIFSWRQWENFLWGFQISFVLPLVSAAYAFYFLSLLPDQQLRARSRHVLIFIAAAACATVATFSSAMGLLVWLVGVVQLLFILDFAKLSKRYLLWWSLVGIAAWIIYYNGYQHPAAHPSPGYVLTAPLAVAKFVLAVIGSALTDHLKITLPAGAGILLLFLITLGANLRRKGFSKNSFMISLGLYTLLALTIISIGRAALGLKAALASRYTSYSIAFVIATYVMGMKLAVRARSLLVMRIITVILIGSVIAAYWQGYVIGRERKQSLDRKRILLLNYEKESDESLRIVYPEPKVVRQMAPVLKRLSYNVFYSVHNSGNQHETGN